MSFTLNISLCDLCENPCGLCGKNKHTRPRVDLSIENPFHLFAISEQTSILEAVPTQNK